MGDASAHRYEAQDRDKDRDRVPFRGQFAFQDRESGVFYQAFEQEFQAYLWQTYRAKVTHIDITNSRSGNHTQCPLTWV